MSEKKTRLESGGLNPRSMAITTQPLCKRRLFFHTGMTIITTCPPFGAILELQSDRVSQSILPAVRARRIGCWATDRRAATHLRKPCFLPLRPTQKKSISTLLALGNKKCLLGTPDTSRSGRNTRKARRALTSKPPDLPLEWFPPSVSLVNCSKITLNNLKEKEKNVKSLPPREANTG